MSEAAAQFRRKFRLDELAISENENWLWSLRPLQCTLGAGILSLKPYAERFSEITPEAGRDLTGMVKVIERTLHATFNYDKINYLMLMMVDPPVHFHVVPRYEQAIEQFGRTWNDAGWPGPPVLSGEEIDSNLLAMIRDALRDALS